MSGLEDLLNVINGQLKEWQMNFIDKVKKDKKVEFSVEEIKNYIELPRIGINYLKEGGTTTKAGKGKAKPAAKRVMKEVPMDERCLALTKGGIQCSKRRLKEPKDEDDSELCSNHNRAKEAPKKVTVEDTEDTEGNESDEELVLTEDDDGDLIYTDKDGKVYLCDKEGVKIGEVVEDAENDKVTKKFYKNE